MKIKTYLSRGISIILVLTLLFGLQRLVEPKYATNLLEGGFTSAYYDEASGHQVLMVGDCELYENFDPVTLWENYGISSYIRGNAQQLTWQSYYLLKEALKYETPEVVIFSVLELKYDEPQKEEYNRLTIDGMKWSTDKWRLIHASMTKDENMAEYLFPILRYHSRITQLTKEDKEYYLKKHAPNTVSGYYMRIDASPYEIGQWGDENDIGQYDIGDIKLESDVTDEEWSAEADEEWSAEADEKWSAEPDEEWSAEVDEEWSAEEDEEWSIEADEEVSDEKTSSAEGGEGDFGILETEVEPLGENAMHYLDLIRKLCEKNNIRLLLVKAPSVSPVWHDEWESQIVDYAKQYKLDYINYLDLTKEIGINFETDTYDGGLHMNYSGAIKCAEYLGEYLVGHYNLTDMRKDSILLDKWKKIKENQQVIFQIQNNELETYGEVISY